MSLYRRLGQTRFRDNRFGLEDNGSNNKATFQLSELSDDREYKLPDGDGTLLTDVSGTNYLEIIKSGNSVGDDGNCRFIIDGNNLILEAKSGGVWVDTGFKIGIG